MREGERREGEGAREDDGECIEWQEDGYYHMGAWQEGP